MTPIEIARFWSRARVGTDFQCWEWTGVLTPKGYGRFSNTAAHRIAYTLIYGPIEEGAMVLHRCDNPKCCNPRHLELGSHAKNMADAVDRKRMAHGARHPKSRLTKEQAAYIRANPDGKKQAELAKQFGVTESAISYIRNGKRRIYERQN